jgi:DNA topoisomerase-3
VCRRLLQAWQGDCIEAVTIVKVDVSLGDACDRYVARGSTVVRMGWKALEVREADVPPGQGEAVMLPPRLVAGTPLTVCEAVIENEKTKPKERYTEATLLKAMELAGRSLSDELAEAMRARGLGTPATRAAIIETLLAREYIVRKKKALVSTERGRQLVARVHPHVRNPAMTGEWEQRLRRMEEGHGSYEEFVKDVSKFVRSTVQEALAHGVASREPRAASNRTVGKKQAGPRSATLSKSAGRR